MNPPGCAGFIKSKGPKNRAALAVKVFIVSALLVMRRFRVSCAMPGMQWGQGPCRRPQQLVESDGPGGFTEKIVEDLGVATYLHEVPLFALGGNGRAALSNTR